MWSVWFKVAMLGSSLLVAGGCSSEPSEPIVVTGVVYYSDSQAGPDSTSRGDSAELVGKPIVGAKVTFHDNDIPIGYGITDTLGRFRIRSYPTRSEPIDGLPEGLYAVTITKLSLVEMPGASEPDVHSGGAAERPLPARYAHPDTTDWKLMKVKLETSTNHFRLAVKE